MAKSASLDKLFDQQLENYARALQLEKELSELISRSDFDAISQNTRLKTELMQSIERIHARIEPELTGGADREGRELAESLKSKRAKAVELLTEITRLEKANLEALGASRVESIAQLKQTRTAKQTARGYKPRPERSSKYLDTKR